MRKCLVALTLLFSYINTSFALDGLGTAASPWLIQSLADFDEFTANSAYWSGHTRLDTNIDLTGITYTRAPIAPDPDTDSDWDGIAFTGTFDGNNHTISNLTISNGAHYLGLFGYIDGGSVTNLTMVNFDILSTTTGVYVGGLCGKSLENTTFTNCHIDSTVTGESSVGGLCGSNGGTITSCDSTGSVTGNDMNAGGLCGHSRGGSITDCHSTSSVEGGYYTGGLCGASYGNNSITDCYATGSVAGTGDGAGGLCGYNNASNITNSYSTSTVTGSFQTYTGGLCGVNEQGNITDCYAIGTVTGDDSAGGLCGVNAEGAITGSYSTSTVNGGMMAGGLCGTQWEGSTITNCYASGDVSGEMDLVGGLCGNNDGTITNSYSTSTVNGGMMAGGFCGGNQGTITNSYSTSTVTGEMQSVGGFCGTNDGTITNCYAAGDATGDMSVGGLCGSMQTDGSITNCYAIGAVTGSDYVAGLCGDSSGTITSCFWDIQASGTTDGVGNMDPDPVGVSGKTTTEMQDINTFLAANWDFENLWHMPYQSTGYPMLFFQRDIPGDFTASYGVNLADFATFSQAWLTSSGQPGYNEDCDLADDDTINLADLTIFAENFLQGL